jgi:hypothetical protein
VRRLYIFQNYLFLGNTSNYILYSSYQFNVTHQFSTSFCVFLICLIRMFRTNLWQGYSKFWDVYKFKWKLQNNYEITKIQIQLKNKISYMDVFIWNQTWLWEAGLFLTWFVVLSTKKSPTKFHGNRRPRIRKSKNKSMISTETNPL